MMREVPFVRLLLPLLGGFLLYRLYPLTIDAPASVLYVFLPALLLLSLRPLPYSRRHHGGIFATVGLLIWGYALNADHDSFRKNCHFSHLPEGVDTYWGVVQSCKSGEDWHRLVVSVKGGVENEEWSAACGQVQLYAARDAGHTPQTGQKISWRGRPQPVRGAENPLAFDYRSYLADRHIHHQVFVRAADWRCGEEPGDRVWIRRIEQARLWCINRLSSHLPEERSRGVALALILGHKAELTDEVREAYAGTGAMHILAVSGLHVGLVYLLLQLMVKFAVPHPRLRRWLSLPFVIGGIWAYAMLTGGAPSALRAATMFSFLAAGRHMRRGSSVYNTLAASAFVLLCLQPSLLWQVGFQLSYLAVTGIVFFQPRLYRLWSPPGRLPDHLWALVTVSVAAQLTTLPLTLYVFNQFPLLFWLSGLLAVPAASAILSIGLLTLLLDLILPVAAEWSGALLRWLVHATNSWINGLMELPFDHVRELYIDAPTVWLLYLGLVLIATAVTLRSGRWLMVSLCVFNFALVRHHVLMHHRRSTEAVCVYALKEATVIDYFRNGWRYSWSSSSPPEAALRHAARTFRLFMGARHAPEQTLLSDGAGWFQIGRHYGLRIDGSGRIPEGCANPAFLLVGGSADRHMERMLDACRPGMIILESSLPYQMRQSWKKAAECRSIPCHDIRSDGAWLSAFSTIK